jgi:hypothetical protein
MTLQEAAHQHKAGETFEYEGSRYKLCKNGSIAQLGVSGTRFVHGVPPVATRITTENAADMAYQRWHGGRQDAARQAVRDALNDDRIDSVEAADAYMTYALVREVVLDQGARGSDRVKAYESVLAQSGMDGRAPKQAQPGPQSGVTLSIGADVAAQMMAQLLGQANKRGLLE